MWDNGSAKGISPRKWSPVPLRTESGRAFARLAARVDVLDVADQQLNSGLPCGALTVRAAWSWSWSASDVIFVAIVSLCCQGLGSSGLRVDTGELVYSCL